MLIVASVIGLTISRAKTEQSTNTTHEVIILNSFVVSFTGTLVFDGMAIYDSSSSAGAPKYPQFGNGVPLAPTAQTISDLISLPNRPYHIVHTSADGNQVILSN